MIVSCYVSAQKFTKPTLRMKISQTQLLEYALNVIIEAQDVGISLVSKDSEEFTDHFILVYMTLPVVLPTSYLIQLKCYYYFPHPDPFHAMNKVHTYIKMWN